MKYMILIYECIAPNKKEVFINTQRRGIGFKAATEEDAVMQEVSLIFKFFLIIFYSNWLTNRSQSTITAAGGASNTSAGGAATTSVGDSRGAAATAATGEAAGAGEKANSTQLHLLII